MPLKDVFSGDRAHVPSPKDPKPAPLPPPAPRPAFIASDETAFTNEDLDGLFAAGQSVPLSDDAKPNLNATVGKTLRWMEGVGLNQKKIGLKDFVFGFFVVKGDQREGVGVHPHLYVVFKTPQKKLVEAHSMEAIEEHGSYSTAVSLMHLFDADNKKEDE